MTWRMAAAVAQDFAAPSGDSGGPEGLFFGVLVLGGLVALVTAIARGSSGGLGGSEGSRFRRHRRSRGFDDAPWHASNHLFGDDDHSPMGSVTSNTRRRSRFGGSSGRSMFGGRSTFGGGSSGRSMFGGGSSSRSSGGSSRSGFSSGFRKSVGSSISKGMGKGLGRKQR